MSAVSQNGLPLPLPKNKFPFGKFFSWKTIPLRNNWIYLKDTQQHSQ